MIAQEYLHDGVQLCNLIKKVRPDLMPEFAI